MNESPDSKYESVEGGEWQEMLIVTLPLGSDAESNRHCVAV
jgi:hypothetical protein